MNKKHLGIVALFILCFSFALAGKSAQAATTPQETSVSKIAYVDASGRLVLKFADFSDAGYTYTVTNEKTGAKTDTAQLASKKGVLTVSLGQLYSAKTGYKLILTSKDNTKKLTVHYYTGKALGSYSIKQKSNDSVKASWTVSDKIYTRYSLELYLGGNSTVAQKRISVGKTAASASIASSSLKNARYYKGDYIALSVLKSTIATTFAYIIVFLMYILCDVEKLVADINSLDYAAMGKKMALYYVIMLVVFAVISGAVSAYKYDRSRSGMKKYFSRLNKLERFYNGQKNRK